MKLLKKLFYIILLVHTLPFAQGNNLKLDFKNIREETRIPEGVEKNTLLLIGGITATVAVAVDIYLSNNYWQGRDRSFHTNNDHDRYLYMDKLGYFWLANQLLHQFSAGLEWGGVESEKTYLYGALGAILYGTYLEVSDGFSRQGFNYTDYGAGILGAGYALTQYYIPVLKEFQPRLSYYPSERLRENSSASENIFNDFNGQKYWLGIRINNLLGDNLAEYWPSFLMISIGTGVSNIHTPNPRRDIYVAFDIDAESIPLYGPFWQFIKNTLNYFHFPMPGIRLTNGVALFAFCY